MRRSLFRTLMLAAALAPLTACGSSTTTTPTAPAVVTLADTFTGTVSVNGAFVYPFTISSTGSVTATLLTETPDASVSIGLGLGTWNGTSCAVLVSNDSVAEGGGLIATANSTGQFCLRVFDPLGHLPAPVTYTIAVIHP